MDSDRLFVAAGKTLTCCDFEERVQFQVQLDKTATSLAASQTHVISGEWTHFTPPQIFVLDLHGNRLQVIRASRHVTSIKFNKSGSRFACGIHTCPVIVYELQDTTWVQLTELQKTSSCSSLEWLDDQQICAIDEEGVSIWDSSSGTLLKSLDALAGMSVSTLCIHPDDSDTLLFGTHTGLVRKYNVCDGSLVEIHPFELSVSRICANDNVVVAVTSNCVKAFDVLTMDEIWRFKQPELINSICIFQNFVFLGLQNSPVMVLDASTGEELHQFPTKNEGYVFLRYRCKVDQHYNSWIDDLIKWTCPC